MVRLSVAKPMFRQNYFLSHMGKQHKAKQSALAKLTTPDPIKIENIDEDDDRVTSRSRQQFRTFTNSAISKSGIAMGPGPS